MIAALIVFLGTYAVVALGRQPGLRLDRAGAALIGASLMVGLEVLNLEDAYRAIDLNTIVLLARALAPVAALGLVVLFVLVVLMFHREFLVRSRFEIPTVRVRFHRALLIKALIAAVSMIGCFFAGVPPTEVAIIGGALLLLTRRLKPERVYREIDWALLLLFAGLFVVVRGLEAAALTPDVLRAAEPLTLDEPPVLALAAAALSNVVSNVPTVLVLKPVVAALAHPGRAWLVLAMASTLAGNLTLLGSMANLIVVERARRHRVAIDFWTYLKLGVPVTVLTVAIGAWWMR